MLRLQEHVLKLRYMKLSYINETTSHEILGILIKLQRRFQIFKERKKKDNEAGN